MLVFVYARACVRVPSVWLPFGAGCCCEACVRLLALCTPIAAARSDRRRSLADGRGKGSRREEVLPTAAAIRAGIDLLIVNLNVMDVLCSSVSCEARDAESRAECL